MSQSHVSPVEALRQMRSALPSPSKSPAAARIHAELRLVRKRAELMALAFISQSHVSPVPALRQTRSDLSSPSKSLRTPPPVAPPITIVRENWLSDSSDSA